MSRPAPDQFVQGILDQNYYTQDLAALYKKKYIPLFVYGTLKQGFSRFNAMDGAIYLGPGYTRGTGFLMYATRHKYPYPIALPMLSSLVPDGERAPTAGGIQGEVYLVPPRIIQSLDFLESNGIAYQRSTYMIDLPADNGQPNVYMTCMMYVGVIPNWRPDVLKGRILLCDYYTRNKNKNYGYYSFTKKTIDRCAVASATIRQTGAPPF